MNHAPGGAWSVDEAGALLLEQSAKDRVDKQPGQAPDRDSPAQDSSGARGWGG